MEISGQNIKNLLSSVSSDDRGAFERFYNLYYDQVFRFAYYCLGEKEACKEVVSDVFFSIWKSKIRLRDVDNINTYLYVTVRNEALRHISKNNSVNKIPMDQLCSFEPEEESTPDGILESREMRELLNLAIDELPEKCRLIFLMIREEGLSTKEIAKILSIQESTVRVQMKIAVEKLITRLKSDFPDISFVLILMSILQ
ncbi:RNA polymerase sigma-70 factor [uncultured Parabacteroides sp.]|uniref:RNA polymerase sigma factor n=1 Tax=uncultured Parabacteroides sp. TaxID=512312 RepID=UPI002624FAE7|nr:RNA polymerase sigma-70 factor [uncultured Parabacteroides sp.]